MGIKLKFGSMSDFLPGENVLRSMPNLGVVSGKALPSYRVFFPLPLFSKAALYVTDRRVFLVIYMLGRVIQEVSLWHPGKPAFGDDEVIQATSVGKLWFLGKYLEVITYNPSRTWYWRCVCSRTIRLRFYMKKPEPFCQSISERLGADRKSG